MHYMAIGQDKTVRSEDEPRTGSFAVRTLDLNVNDGGTNPLYRTHYSSRVTVEQFMVRMVKPFLLMCQRHRSDILQKKLQRIHRPIWMRSKIFRFAVAMGLPRQSSRTKR